ncbi:S26 family signal peptidase [Ferrovibrio sp.]|uniref:S26 family signal peptidase n=1 Tax=Ferrovibrio sp. TaxID=1917215 RepID=UPI00311E0866
MRNLQLILGGSITGQRRRRPSRRKRLILVLMAVGLAALGAAALLSKRPLLIWNASASAPRGLYRTVPLMVPRHGDWVLAWLPDYARQLAAERGYLPADIPVIKPVAAMAGDQVCAAGNTIRLVSGATLHRLKFDSQGRPLPAWQGCRTMTTDEVFLANPAAADSFDSRYFGPVQRNSLIGRVVPVWLR